MSLSYDIIAKSDDREAWLAARMAGIGASEIAAALGVDERKSPYALWAEKMGGVEPPDLSDVEAVEWGNRLEPVIITAFAERTGRPAERAGQLLRSREHPWALATLDAWNEPAPRVRRPLEVKTTSAFLADAWVDGPPEPYRLQVQQQMLVTGEPSATITCLLGGQRMVWCDIERDEPTIRRIVHHGEAFWRRVQEHDAPDADGSASTARALAELFREDDGSTIELPGALREAVEELAALRADKSKEDRQRELENAIKAALGAAQTGVLPGGFVVTWKSSQRAGYTVAPTTVRSLRIKQPKEK